MSPRRWKFLAAAVVAMCMAIIFATPKYPFDSPYSLVVTDSSGILIGARIASDGQWRFPQSDSVPYKFQKCIIAYEDKRFLMHLGVDFMAIARAIYLDVTRRKIVSGGSTITMQTVRLSRNAERTFFEKFIECIQAIRLELRFSKEEIMAMYASHAPFGGNTVGLETAARRYFGRPAANLSWAESAMLAVLPNNPSLVHLGRNRDKLLLKRNELLQKLKEQGVINEETCILAQNEPLPQSPKQYPQIAPHLVDRIACNAHSETVKTTINAALQIRSSEILERHIHTLATDGIYNGAVLIMEVSTGNVVTYIGNTMGIKGRNDANDVDIIQSRRSTGSILKPFLYCAMLSEGLLLPNTLVPDIPTQISGYMPKNFRLTYDGAVPAGRALARSLNVPAVKMLQQYSGEKFITILQKLQITTVDKPSDYYGLSLILGGCEATLWQLCGAYASMARSLNNYVSNNNTYSQADYRPPQYLPYQQPSNTARQQHSFLSAGAIYHTLNALTTVERPDDEMFHEMFSSDRIVAWKTGTSFGFRDAWAIGICGNYVIGVWTGNADGEGRPSLIGIKASAPILFDIIKLLPYKKQTFATPYDDLVEARICHHSGYLAGVNCNDIDTMLIPSNGTITETCPYCKLIHLDMSQTYRVTADCESPSNIIHKKWFVLPPAMEYYYKQHNPNYHILPPLRSDCRNCGAFNDQPLQVIYPTENAKIFLPKGFDNSRQRMVIEAASRNKSAKLFWHLDNNYISTTQDIHTISIEPKPGKHTIIIADQDGNTTRCNFEIIGQ